MYDSVNASRFDFDQTPFDNAYQSPAEDSDAWYNGMGPWPTMSIVNILSAGPEDRVISGTEDQHLTTFGERCLDAPVDANLLEMPASTAPIPTLISPHSGSFSYLDEISQDNRLPFRGERVARTPSRLGRRPVALDMKQQEQDKLVSEPLQPMPRFSSSESLGNGSLSWSSGRYTCTQCGESFKNSFQLEQHARAEQHRTYICPEPECGMSFCRRDTFRRHQASHKSAGFYTCEYCHPAEPPHKFRRKDHLSQHIRNMHGQNDRCWSDATYNQDLKHKPAGIGRRTSVSSERSSKPISWSGDNTGSGGHQHDANISPRQAWKLINDVVGGNNAAVDIMERDISKNQASEVYQLIARLTLLDPKELRKEWKSDLTSLAHSSA